VFAQWDFPLHYKNKRYVPPIKFVENQNNLGNTSVTHGMNLYRKGKCLGANSLISKCVTHCSFLSLQIKREDIIDKCHECDKDRSIHNFKGCLYRVEQINLHEMEILAQPLCETLLPFDLTMFTPTTFRHTKKLPIRISKPSHKKFHFKNRQGLD
jgi:hypothetical protein